MRTLFSPSYLAVAILSLVLILVSIACTQLESAADFQVTLFNGEEFTLSEQVGRSATVVNFWYPSCPPCREEMPQFEAAWREYQGDGVRFLGLFVPTGFDSEQDARDFVDELGLTFDFATDHQALIAQSYQIEFFPTTYFIDINGKVSRMVISNLDQDTIAGIISELDRG